MTIPAFSAAGVLPPFVGSPAGLGRRSPYPTRTHHVVARFATSSRRCEILRGWLAHRGALHALGFRDGFQWLDGSFCEQLRRREPSDLDVATFFVPPPAVDLGAIAERHPHLFLPALSKERYLCDAYFVALHVGGLAEPRTVSYWYSLFSHRRHDLTWKGILEVPLDPVDDAAAAEALNLASGALSPSGSP